MTSSDLKATTADKAGEETPRDQQGENNWTIIIYHSGDADLGEEFVWAMKDMVRVGTPQGVEVVALMDSVAPDLWELTIPPGTSLTRTLQKTESEQAGAAKEYGEVQLFDKKGGRARVVREEDYNPRVRAEALRARLGVGIGANLYARADLSSSELLRDFVIASIQDHPARHYLLLLTGHGAGIVGNTFLRDQGSGRYMSIPKLDWALGEVVKEIGESFRKVREITAKGFPDTDSEKEPDSRMDDFRIDILGLDSCGMMTAEVAFLLKDEVKNLVASEGFMTLEGWPYHKILEYMNKVNSNPEPEVLAAEIVRGCVRYYSDFARVGSSVDLAACKLDQKGWHSLTASIGRLSQHLKDEIKDQSVINAIIAAHLCAQSYASEQYVDLHDFCEQLMKADPRFKDDCARIIKDLSSLLLKSCYAGAGYQHSHGISLYFPWVTTKAELDRYCEYIPLWKCQDRTVDQKEEPTLFNKATAWGDFLREFIELTRREPRQDPTSKDRGELIFMPPEGYFDHVDDHRTGTPVNTRTGTPANTRGKAVFAKVKNISLEYYEDKCEAKDKGPA